MTSSTQALTLPRASSTVSSGPAVGRVVALGASNLTRGLQSVVGTARARWGNTVELLLALGLGRSYGASNRVFVRTLPGILECALWEQLDSAPPLATRALITDVGNDILYGAPPSEIVGWVEECVVRLQRHTSDIVLTDLPLDSIRALGRAKYMAFRTFLWPQCRLSHREVLARAEAVTAGLEALAAARQIRFFRLKPEWYGFDPVHIRPRLWNAAWQELLHGDHEPSTPPTTPPSDFPWAETLRLYSLPPERRWLAGIEQRTPQSGHRLPGGGRVWLY